MIESVTEFLSRLLQHPAVVATIFAWPFLAIMGIVVLLVLTDNPRYAWVRQRTS